MRLRFWRDQRPLFRRWRPTGILMTGSWEIASRAAVINVIDANGSLPRRSAALESPVRERPHGTIITLPFMLGLKRENLTGLESLMGANSNERLHSVARNASNQNERPLYVDKH